MISGLIYSIISAVAFGMLVIFAKLGYAADMTAMEMLQCRFTLGAVILLGWFAATDLKGLLADRKTILRCALIGMFIYPVQSFCFIAAAKYIPAATDALILYFYPVMVTIFSAIFYKMKINRTVVLSLLLVLAGCALVFYDAFLQQMDSYGIMLASVAMITFATYLTIVQSVLKDTSPLKATFYVILFTSITYNVLGDPTMYFHMNGTQWAIGSGLGLFCSVIAIAFLYLAVEKVGSAYAAIFSSIEPIATLIAAHFLLGEHIVLLQAAGAALIIAGIVTPNFRAVYLKRKLAR